ncbi:NIPSNAP family containing protein [Actinomadura craniellae]|uniref:NIPSNAP family containing protein n=1 Tax=Actinomadura craniellae TaxID=2231787 RepID=A0A365HAT4_9ACTN|nr:NIPSNAP family containing protein [Actinomadura craniellae]RAY16250.1 NIPSNAP family containing protein [Actinomadura craniellae]
MNDKVYIHEFIHITKQNRARYMHHMTANWSPIGQEQRGQLCYGVWGLVGSTGPWPQVVNIWEEDGFAGLASSFRLELGNAGLQDPALAKWWAAAADLRSGGVDRILVPHPGTRTIEELCKDGVRGEVYAHELVRVSPGGARRFLDAAMEDAAAGRDRHGWQLVGAWSTAMRNDQECVLLWAIPTWEDWAGVEADEAQGRSRLLDRSAVMVRDRERVLLADAPLCPFKTGRQPSRDDRTDWVD